MAAKPCIVRRTRANSLFPCLCVPGCSAHFNHCMQCMGYGQVVPPCGIFNVKYQKW